MPLLPTATLPENIIMSAPSTLFPLFGVQSWPGPTAFWRGEGGGAWFESFRWVGGWGLNREDQEILPIHTSCVMYLFEIGAGPLQMMGG